MLEHPEIGWYERTGYTSWMLQEREIEDDDRSWMLQEREIEDDDRAYEEARDRKFDEW